MRTYLRLLGTDVIAAINIVEVIRRATLDLVEQPVVGLEENSQSLGVTVVERMIVIDGRRREGEG